jgi:hypothetical protein
MYEGMDFYLKNQGNLVISSTNRMKKLCKALPAMREERNFWKNGWGSIINPVFSTFSNSLAINPYLVSAEGLDSYPDIALNTATPFSAVIGSCKDFPALRCLILYSQAS